jgi:glycosyltransferase involved in cell wall biosynthesis
MPAEPRIAVLIPCFNEHAEIANVVAAFRAQLPAATVYVYDNNSTDGTAAAAAAAGATVRAEPLQGKGHVVRRMFADIEADAYILVDGDNTYDPAAAPEMLRLLLEHQLDMVNAQRITTTAAAYRRGHQTGNMILSFLVRAIFGNRIQDLLSGYRAFSRRFVKTFPAISAGFETETEFTIHALNLFMPIAEIPTAYRARNPNSASKLNTYRDGLRILHTIFILIKEERPLQFFTTITITLLAVALTLATPILSTYLQTHLVPRLPTAVLAASITILAFLSFTCGLILDSTTRTRKETKRIAYLAIPRFGG